MVAALAETSSQTLLTGVRCLTSSSAATVSGIGTTALPRSVTLWPRSSRHGSMRAYRMALGPISTPRLSWPRSIGTPKIPTGPRPFSSNSSPSRTTGIGRRLEAPVRRTSDRVDPAEEHVGCLVAQHAFVAVEVRRARTGLVGEEIPLRVKARGEDRALQRHPEIQHVYDRL